MGENGVVPTAFSSSEAQLEGLNCTEWEGEENGMAWLGEGAEEVGGEEG